VGDLLPPVYKNHSMTVRTDSAGFCSYVFDVSFTTCTSNISISVQLSLVPTTPMGRRAETNIHSAATRANHMVGVDQPATVGEWSGITHTIYDAY